MPLVHNGTDNARVRNTLILSLALQGDHAQAKQILMQEMAALDADNYLRELISTAAPAARHNGLTHADDEALP